MEKHPLDSAVRLKKPYFGGRRGREIMVRDFCEKDEIACKYKCKSRIKKFGIFKKTTVFCRKPAPGGEPMFAVVCGK